MKAPSIMMTAIGLVTCGFLASAGIAGADQDQVDISSCGHLEEIDAARKALREGDEESALIHFRAAREILRACEKQVEAEAPSGFETVTHEI